MTEPAKKKILVADDEPMNLQLFSALLERNGYEVATAKDGLEAVAKAKSMIPDLILMDIMMPNLDGIAATAQLAKDPATKKIPVLYISAIADQENNPATSGISPARLLGKPVIPKVLLGKISEILGST